MEEQDQSNQMHGPYKSPELHLVVDESYHGIDHGKSMVATSRRSSIFGQQLGSRGFGTLSEDNIDPYIYCLDYGMRRSFFYFIA